MKNLVEVAQDWKKGINNMIRASKDVEEGTREKIYEILRILGDIIKENFKENIIENLKKS